MSAGFFIELGVRCLLVVLFLPFSALDKIINFRGAVAQAKQKAPSQSVAVTLILAGMGVEIIMSLGVVTGIADRLAAFLLSGYCVVTALLWKQFWMSGDFWRTGESKGRNLFWDFLKNISLAGGFLLITFGTTDTTGHAFFAHPLASSEPYVAIHPGVAMEQSIGCPCGDDCGDSSAARWSSECSQGDPESTRVDWAAAP